MAKRADKKNKSESKGGKKAKGPTRAELADRHDLYQKSVQVPEVDVEFFAKVFKKTFKRPATLLREDFCGTFALACEWIKSGTRKNPRSAIGVDFDLPTLDWGREHNLSDLDADQRKRMTIYQHDVRAVRGKKADIVAAQNFSYFVFKTRDELRDYFRVAYENTADEGLFITDLLGGHLVLKYDHTLERRRLKGFSYEWEQISFNPVNHDVVYHINFSFRDGSRLDQAFRYEWRLWTIPEVRELMADVGFETSDVYWEGTDEETGEGNGVYEKTDCPENDPAWVSYVIATKGKPAGRRSRSR